ncbi:MAG: hypothetical protein E7066_00190 [Lentimicrobiaceae bacterium]|nr:hypothetical protein [Lentimicrobiaceae bacterium]
MKNLFYKILFGLTISVFVLIMTQTIWHPFKFKALAGVTDKVEMPELNFNTYSDGSFQSDYDEYLMQNFGFREPLLRFYNQYLWSLFGKENIDHIVPGKEGWIFYKHHIDDYYGQEMYRWQNNTDAAIDRYEREISLMKKLRGVLKEYGIEFLMFVAPDKAFIYPEYLPYQEFDTTTINARKYYVERFVEEGFPHIDMTEMFIKMKDTTDYLLMPSKGAHWNNTCVYGVDTLLRLMETLKNDKLAEFKYGEAIPSYRHLKAEADIEGYMNLIFPKRIPEKFQTKERLFEIITDSSTVKPNVLFVGNSYLFQIYDYIPVEEIFSDMNHWYYNNVSYSGFKRLYKNINDIDRLQTILLSDYVVWFADGCQIYKTSYGFVEDALIRLCINDERYDEVKNIHANKIYKDKLADLKKNNSEIDSTTLMNNSIRQAVTEINNNPDKYFEELKGDDIPKARNRKNQEILLGKQIIHDKLWYDKIKSYSVLNMITIEEAIKEEISNLKNNKDLIKDMNIVLDDKEYFDYLVNKVVDEIKANPTLMEEIKQKAIKRNKTLEQAVIDDAKWIVNNRMKNANIKVEVN